MTRVDAFILAAGLGTRMGPLSRVLPKPAWPIGGRSLLAWSAEGLRAAGFGRLACNVHHLPDLMAAAAREADVEACAEPVLLGSAGGLGHVASRASDPLAVWNADALAEVPWAAFLEAHRASGADLSWLLVPHPGGPANPVWLDGEDRLILGRPGPRGPFHFTGAALWGPRALALLGGGACDVKAEVLPRVRALGVPVAPFPMVEVGTPRELIAAAGLLAPQAEGRVEGCYVHPDAVPGGRLEGCVLGPGAVVPPGLADRDALWFGDCGRQVRLAL